MTDAAPLPTEPTALRRTLIWFSAGAASAVAAKIMLQKRQGQEVVIAYTNPGSEHPDNERFLADCEAWFGCSVVRLRSSRYTDTWDVFQRRRYLNGPAGALCTVELKKMQRFDFQRPDDEQVFGYTIEERRRAERFRANNPDVLLCTPLIDQGLSKSDCLAIIASAGISLPMMYRLGYNNNNCIGCVKGGKGYWNKIRVDFPDTFHRMARLERALGASCINQQFLDTLDPSAGNHKTEPMDCSLLCAATIEELAEAKHGGEPQPRVEPHD